LKHLDALAKSYRFLWQDIEDIANRQHRFPPRHTYKDFKEEELSLKHLEHIHLGLLAKLEEVALLARTTADGGELRAAVYAFTHLLSTYRSLPFNASHQFRQVLLEVASLYVKKEDWIQAEEHWIEVLQLPDTPENVKEQVLQHLAESLPKSSAELTKMFNLAPPLCEIGNDRMPIPPLLRAMRILHECGMNTVPAELLQIGAHRDVTGSPPIHVAIRSGLLPVCDFIMNCPINQLNGIRESRDSFSRTPFLVAALSRQERPGRSIMARFRNEPLLARQQLINATDGTGQTILSIAISSDCSFQYIEELIEFGAVADPPSLMKCIHTPLQAAAIGGRENVVRVLLEHGARNGSVFGKELTARELAQYAGYNNIAELLRLVP
jgi:hypothetical protein